MAKAHDMGQILELLDTVMNTYFSILFISFKAITAPSIGFISLTNPFCTYIDSAFSYKTLIMGILVWPIRSVTTEARFMC